MKATRENPILYIVIPCYNEQEVLPITSKLFLKKITDLVAAGKISDDSRVLFVNDGSKDKTWSIICDLAKSDKHYIGISKGSASSITTSMGCSASVVVPRSLALPLPTA